jgi:uncharacterized membrane protein required for colicin V production
LIYVREYLFYVVIINMLLTVIPKSQEQKDYLTENQKIIKIKKGNYTIYITKKSQSRDITLILLLEYSVDQIIKMMSNNSKNQYIDFVY